MELGSVVGCQHTLFQNNIRRLLDPIVGMDDSLMSRLLSSTDTGHSGWENPNLTEKLKDRLSDSYDSYMTTVSAISKTLKQLEDNLGISMKDVNATAVKVSPTHDIGSHKVS